MARPGLKAADVAAPAISWCRKSATRTSANISAMLAEAGHLNEHGRPFNPRSIKAMVES